MTSPRLLGHNLLSQIPPLDPSLPQCLQSSIQFITASWADPGMCCIHTQNIILKSNVHKNVREEGSLGKRTCFVQSIDAVDDSGCVHFLALSILFNKGDYFVLLSLASVQQLEQHTYHKNVYILMKPSS